MLEVRAACMSKMSLAFCWLMAVASARPPSASCHPAKFSIANTLNSLKIAAQRSAHMQNEASVGR